MPATKGSTGSHRAMPSKAPQSTMERFADVLWIAGMTDTKLREQPVVAEAVFQSDNRPPNARRDYHGFVMDLPWQVAETRAGDEAATVRSTLNSADHPAAHEGFPFPYRVEATYRLDDQGLRLHF